MSSQIKQLNECVICFQEQPLQRYGDCGHKFCNFCVIEMSKCPLCRKTKKNNTFFSQDTHLYKLAKLIGL